MAKKELIDSGSGNRYVMRTETGRFIAVKEDRSSPHTTIQESRGKGTWAARSAKSGQFLPMKEDRGSSSKTVRGYYSMPNGEKIVTVRRDIVDRAIGRKKKK